MNRQRFARSLPVRLELVGLHLLRGIIEMARGCGRRQTETGEDRTCMCGSRTPHCFALRTLLVCPYYSPQPAHAVSASLSHLSFDTNSTRAALLLAPAGTPAIARLCERVRVNDIVVRFGGLKPIARSLCPLGRREKCFWTA